MSKRKYTYEELLQRPEWDDWVEIRKYIPGQTERNDLTVAPEYGYIFDKFRQKYNIYLSVTPKIDPDYTEERKFVLRYTGIAISLNKGSVENEIIITGFNYHSVARNLLKILLDQFILEVNPDKIWIEDENDEVQVQIISNTSWKVS